MRVIVTGGTGYLGRPLIRRLTQRGHRVRALVRAGSEGKVPAGAEAVAVDLFSEAGYQSALDRGDTVVHLLGTPRPAPWKSRQFRSVDLPAATAAIAGAAAGGAGHFVYVSVAHPAPVMKSYIAVRLSCEDALRASGLAATVLRPWYVLGPGHWWPSVLIPAYRLMEAVPATRDQALRLGLVSHDEMLDALEWSVENPNKNGSRVLDVAGIRGIAAERQAVRLSQE